MKKIIYIVFTFLFLFGMIPFSATATETSTEHDDLIALACEVFPEYSELIMSPPNFASGQPRSNAVGNIIATEERKVSDNHYVGIARYSSGYVVIYDNTSNFDLDEESSASHVGSDIIGTAKFIVTTNFSVETFTLNNVGFIIHQNGTGYFTSYGSHSNTYVSSFSQSSTDISYILDFSAYGSSHFSVSFGLGFYGGKLVATVQ